MSLRLFEDVEFGGVDSRSNPVNEPRNRALRCLNWVPKQAGFLELRWGYSTVTMSTVSASTIQTLIPFTLWNGTQYTLIQQGTTWNQKDSAGNITTPAVRGAVFGSTAKSGYYNFNNHLHVGNGADQKFYDGSVWRNNGIRALTTGDVSGATVTVGSADANGIPPAVLSGYQFFAAIYNATTGHVGNRIAIGTRLNFTSTTSDVSIAGLPNLSGEDSEFKLLIGRTGDGAQVPYVITDSGGNFITVPSGNTSITITSSLINGNFELPTRNGIIPSQCTMFAVVGDYIWAADPGSPTLRRSGSQIDANTGIFLGDPAQSWAPNDIQTFPTAQPTTGIFETDLELFVGTKNDCAILTDMAGVPLWRGPWNLGLAGPRAGVKTHHGFYWLTSDKELATFVNGLPVVISEEYEAAELAQLGDSTLSATELIYYRDKSKGIDVIRIEGQLSSGTPYTVIHDFKPLDQRSPYGQGYSSQFLGPLATVFTSAVVRDANGKLRVYAGASTGQLYQLYTGANDVGNEFTADILMLINAGEDRTSIPWLDWYGDPNLVVSIGSTLQSSLTGTPEFPFEVLATQAVQGEEWDFRFRAKRSNTKAIRPYLRLQLTSHSADGDLTLNNPPHCPLESWGRVYEIIPAAGSERGR